MKQTPTTIGEPRLLSTREAAALLGVSEALLRLDRRTRHIGLPYLRIGRRVLYDRAALEAWLEAQANTDASAV